MFFLNSVRRRKVIKDIVKVLEKTYDVRKNYKVSFGHTVPLYLPQFNLAIDFSHAHKRKSNIQSMNMRVYTITSLNDSINTIASLLSKIKQIEAQGAGTAVNQFLTIDKAAVY